MTIQLLRKTRSHNVDQSNNVLQDETFVDFEDALQSGETSNHVITLDFQGQIMYKASVFRLISTGVSFLRNQGIGFVESKDHRNNVR